MAENHFRINYYKNADSGIHIQKIRDSRVAKEEHSHDFFQIYYILHGTLRNVTERGDSQLVKGDAFIIPEGSKHRIYEVDDCLFYTFAFTKESLDLNRKAPPLVKRFLDDIVGGNGVDAKIRLSDDKLLVFEGLLLQLYNEFEAKDIGYADNMRAYATVILTLLARNHFDKAPLTIPKSDNRSRILYCMEYIDTSFTEELTLSGMAKWAAMSRADFCRQFRAVSGTTFAKYLHRARINHALCLIERGYKLSGVCSLCGYNDFSTFYRNFKEIIGCSPKQYYKNLNGRR